MKKILSIILFSTFCVVKAQEPILTFTYDPITGNQIVREFCQSCGTAKPVKEIEAIIEEDLLEISSENIISYHPNPVKEELYLKWDLVNENYVKSIQVIGVNAQILAEYQNKKETNFQNIPFQSYPTGIYIISLSYSNGEQKRIKIIKQ
ncbi:T9SS type A sorting domain-containing protein [Flavobacterium sp. EDS]|uniref:T9SS type A sorting domain-containing protein n=1 Tax=Flavobacterium sp. EDS TaxID=2897328 RepID=UPI001E5F8B0D|nr:T9SS type A sorting domain-containing protein [Flavobacterium sp. EDS]MCD0473974.1 T9SS type A sorting domain-containing protein [Flavobacterium sp. EDS]